MWGRFKLPPGLDPSIHGFGKTKFKFKFIGFEEIKFKFEFIDFEKNKIQINEEFASGFKFKNKIQIDCVAKA